MKNESSVNHTIARLMLSAAALFVVTTLQTNAHAQKLTSYSDSNAKNIIFQGNDFHVHDLFCVAGSNCDVTTNWFNEDMTIATGTVAAGNFNNFASFSDAVGQHVFFVDGNQHLHQFLRGSSGIWGNADPDVLTYGGISAYSANGLETVFYESSNQHVHMLTSSNGISWSDADMFNVSGGTLAMWGTSFTSFSDSAGDHAFYVGTNGHIYQIYDYFTWQYICFPTRCVWVRVTHWADQDVTGSATGNPQTASSRPLSSFTDSSGKHVLYEDLSYHVHQLVNGGSGWADQDLSATAWTFGSVVPVMYFGLTSYATTGSGSEVAFYVGTDSKIYILINNHVTVYPNGSMWAAGNISQGPTVYSCGGPDLTGFTEVVNGQLSDDVFYVANDGNMHRLWAQPGWRDMNLTGGQAFSELPRNFCIN